MESFQLAFGEYAKETWILEAVVGAAEVSISNGLPVANDLKIPESILRGM